MGRAQNFERDNGRAARKRFVLTAAFTLCGVFARTGWGQEGTDRFYPVIRSGDLAALRTLVSQGAVNEKDSRGTTPLMYAAAFGNLAQLQLLLEAGADVNARNPFEATALLWANGDSDKIRMLVAGGADVQVRSELGRTVLMAAAQRSDCETLLEWLAERGADVRAHDSHGASALHIAARAGNVASIRVLLSHGAEADVPDLFIGLTPLGEAARSTSVPAVRRQAAGQREPLLEGVDGGTIDIILNLLQGLAAGGYTADIVTDCMIADLASLQHADGSWRE